LAVVALIIHNKLWDKTFTKHKAPIEVFWQLQTQEAKANYVAKENTKVDENI
jgi:hypothetical protein